MCIVKSKIIITGSSGFIGNRLFKKLNEKKINCIGLSRQKIKGLNQVSSYSSFKNNQNDVLVHLAQNTNTNVKNRVDEIKEFKKLIKKKWRHIIYVSSVNVYGAESSKHHLPNEKVIATNSYTKTKITCEELTRKKMGTVLRFSNLYGPNMCQNTVIGNLINQLRGKGPIVMKETKSVRDFLWIDDAIESILLAIKYKPSATFNVGTGKGTSIKELIKITLQLANIKKKDIIEKNQKIRETWVLIDISHTKKNIKWKPKTSLRVGIKNLLKKMEIV